MSVRDSTPMYYSRASCGCVKMIIVDMPDRRKEVARQLYNAVMAGEAVHRSTVGQAREAIKLGWCDACAPPKPETEEDKERKRLQAWNAGKPI